MRHLIKNSCSDECDVWCDDLTSVNYTSDPTRVTCATCILAAEPFAKAVVKRAVEARYVIAHGVTLAEVTK